MSALLPLENWLPPEALGLNAFNHPWTYQVCHVFHPSALVAMGLSMFLAEHVTGQSSCSLSDGDFLAFNSFHQVG